MFEEYPYIGMYETIVCTPKHVCHLVLLLHIQSRILRDLIYTRVEKQIIFRLRHFYLP
jgi:hypothetical protein